MRESIWNRGENDKEILDDVVEENEDNEHVLFDETEANFGPLIQFIRDENITDVDWNSRKLWLTTIMSERIRVDNIDVDAAFFERFAQRVANINGKTFNRMTPVLEAETDTLRISFIHPRYAVSGLSCCIRKTPPLARIDALSAVTEKLCEEKLLHLFVNFVKAHMNIVICGEPRVGKTEFGKYLSTYIPDYERVITIEDVAEWRYRELKPDSDCVQLMVDDRFTYSDAIKACLKHNPRWICLTETRGNEVRDLIKCFSTGISGITTLHTDDVRKVPERMVNMREDDMNSTQFLNNVYEFIDIALLITINVDKEGKRCRRVSQVGVFGREEGTNKNFCRVIYSDGHFVFDNLPTYTMKKLLDAGVEEPFFNEELFQELEQQGYKNHNEAALKSYSQENSRDIQEELDALTYCGGFSTEEEEC